MPFQLKLAHRGIIIVAVPLLFQAASYTYLKAQIKAAEDHARQQDLSKRIVSKVNVFILDSSRVFDVLVRYYITREEKISREIDAMEKLTNRRAKDVTQLLEEAREFDKAGKIRKLSDEFVQAIDDLRRFSERKSDSQTSIALEFSNSFKFREAIRHLVDELVSLARDEESNVAAATTLEEKTRGDVAREMDIAAGLTALLAVLLSVFLMRGPITELGILGDNATRLASNRPLLKELNSSDEIGEVDRVFHVMARALTEAQVTLQMSEERLQSIIDVLPVALVITDPMGQIESLNPTAEVLFAYRTKKLTGKNISLLLDTRQKDQDNSSIVNWLLTETATRPVAMEGVSSEQERIPVEVSATTFEHSAGKRILATIVDITERYKLERLKRDFVAMVSHDIRTPLSSIKGILEITREERLGPVTDEAKQKLALAEDNATRLLQMVKSLLDLEKLDTGLADIEQGEFEVNFLMQAAINLVSQYAEERSVKIQSEPLNAKGMGDLDLLTQVLTNLLSNAIRYSPPGGTVAVHAKVLDDSNLRFEVSDQGPGVPKRQQAEIFERFKQSNVKRDRKTGFGLGLAICKSIVTQHGQEIGVDSSDGQGSTFWFTVAKAQVDSRLPAPSE